MSAMVHVRVDEQVKEEAAATLAKMGLSVSDAVRMMLMRIAAEKTLPFEVRIPNSETHSALQAAERQEGARFESPEELFGDLGI